MRVDCTTPITNDELDIMRESFRQRDYSGTIESMVWAKAFDLYKAEKHLCPSALGFRTAGVYAVVLNYFESKLEEE